MKNSNDGITIGASTSFIIGDEIDYMTDLESSEKRNAELKHIIDTEKSILKTAMYKKELANNKIELVKCLNLFLATFKIQSDAAYHIGTSQPVISNLKNYKLDDISMELILEYLFIFNQKIKIVSVGKELYFK